MIDLGGVSESWISFLMCASPMHHVYLFRIALVRYFVRYFIFLWDICDMCALYLVIFCGMSLPFAHMCCFRVFTLIHMSLLLCTNASCLFLWVHHVGLGHISTPNPFVLIASVYVNQAHWKPQTLHTQEVLSSVTKKGRLKVSRLLEWVSVINDNGWLLWLMCVL
jgi:hypothetical protein